MHGNGAFAKIVNIVRTNGTIDHLRRHVLLDAEQIKCISWRHYTSGHLRVSV